MSNPAVSSSKHIVSVADALDLSTKAFWTKFPQDFRSVVDKPRAFTDLIRTATALEAAGFTPPPQSRIEELCADGHAFLKKFLTNHPGLLAIARRTDEIEKNLFEIEKNGFHNEYDVFVSLSKTPPGSLERIRKTAAIAHTLVGTRLNALARTLLGGIYEDKKHTAEELTPVRKSAHYSSLLAARYVGDWKDALHHAHALHQLARSENHQPLVFMSLDHIVSCHIALKDQVKGIHYATQFLTMYEDIIDNKELLSFFKGSMVDLLDTVHGHTAYLSQIALEKGNFLSLVTLSIHEINVLYKKYDYVKDMKEIQKNAHTIGALNIQTIFAQLAEEIVNAPLDTIVHINPHNDLFKKHMRKLLWCIQAYFCDKRDSEIKETLANTANSIIKNGVYARLQVNKFAEMDPDSPAYAVEHAIWSFLAECLKVLNKP